MKELKYSKITVHEQEEVLFVGFGGNEKKSLTTFSKETLNELKSLFDQIKLEKNPYKGLVFFSHKSDCFLAGVDVEIIQSLSSVEMAQEGAETGQELFNAIEDFSFPTIALVDGICLGGGLELSLSCKFIIVSDSTKTKLGLPEVMLGVLPGFGGTYRLPKKIGLATSLDYLLTGKQIDAKKAFKLGLADAIVPAERMNSVALRIIKGKFPLKTRSPSLKDTISENILLRRIVFQKARDQVLSLTKGLYPAPLKILEHLEKNFGKKRSDYLQEEALAFGELSQTPQSKNLQHVFFISDFGKKMPTHLTENVQSLHPALELKKGGVIGAGVMGGGIAWLLADNGMNPFMKDIGNEALELGLKQASSIFKSALKRKKISEDEYERKMRSINPTTSDETIKSADLIVEAIVEDMNIKKKVWGDLESKTKENALLTSNTSSLSITEMASVFKNPGRFAGLHFFNPVNKMPLIEIITHDKIEKETVKSLYSWALKVKKTPVIVKDGPGFLVNRILATYLNEAQYLLLEGNSIEDIDHAATDFGLPMGPFRLMDEVGLDVSEKVGQIIYKGLGERFRSTMLSDKIKELGFKGKKSKKGFYLYEENEHKPTLNLEIKNVISELRLANNVTSKVSDLPYLQMRLILPMINEAARCLEEKIVTAPEYLDIAMIYGIGFPPFRGGLLKYADDTGLSQLKPFYEEFSKEISVERYSLCGYFAKLISENKTFYRN